MLRKLLIISIALALSTFLCIGCSTEKEPDFTGYKKIAELSALKCTYHNVAEIKNPGTNLLFGLNLTYKKAWFEYEGSVNLGIDVNQVTIEKPSSDGVVTVKVPAVKVLGLPDADPSTFSDVYLDTGLFAGISTMEQSEAYRAAQEEMKKSAEEDSALMNQAQQRVQTLLEQYVINVGKSIGKDYTVKFSEA